MNLMEQGPTFLLHLKMGGDIKKVLLKAIVITGAFAGDWKTGKHLKPRPADL